MSRFRSIFGWLAAGLVVFAAWQGGVALLRGDPMAEMRQATEGLRDDEPAIRWRDVTVRNHDRAQLIHEARVAEMNTSRDRQVVRAKGIRGGRLFRDSKEFLRYEAARATWNDVSKMLSVEDSIRFMNDEVDLRTTKLTYESREGRLMVPEPMKGRFFGGQLSAQRLEATFDPDIYRAFRVAWVGALAQAENAGANPPRRRTWTITAEETVAESDDLTIFLNARATDGEIIVKAQRVERRRGEGSPETLVASGNVRYFSKDLNLICERATIFRQERRAVIEGRVTVLLKPEGDSTLREEPLQPMRPTSPEEVTRVPRTGGDGELDRELRRPENRRKYPVRVLAQRVELWYAEGSRRAIVTGSPQARQDLGPGRWRMMWAPRAEWDGENDRLTLRGAAKRQEVRFMASNGDDAQSDTLTLSTREDVEAYSASNLRATFAEEEEEASPPADPNGA